MGRRRAAPLVAAALLLAPTASAQDMPTPYDYTTAAEMDRFRTCRAAAFYHLDGPDDPEATVPRPVARTLLDQIDFIAGEAIAGKSPGSVDDIQALLEVAESFFLGFNRVLAETRAEMADAAYRDALLLDCIPWVWATTRLFVDELAAWRRAAIASPAPLPPAEAQGRLDDVMRRLGGRD